MKIKSSLLVNSTHKTKPWWVFVSILVFVLVPFVIVWVLCGELNVLDLNWLIAKGQSVWHGTVSENNIEMLANKYYIFCEGGKEQLYNQLLNFMDKQASIESYKTFFDPIVLVPLLGLFAIAIIYPMIFNVTKVSGLDILPFSSSLGMFCLSFIFTGLIPIWGQFFLCIIVRIVIAFALAIATFFFVNFCVNKYLANKDYGYDLILGYKVIDSANASAKEELKKNVEAYNKQKEEETSYVELPKE